LAVSEIVVLTVFDSNTANILLNCFSPSGTQSIHVIISVFTSMKCKSIVVVVEIPVFVLHPTEMSLIIKVLINFLLCWLLF